MGCTHKSTFINKNFNPLISRVPRQAFRSATLDQATFRSAEKRHSRRPPSHLTPELIWWSLDCFLMPNKVPLHQSM